jgi:hypothetical protein
MPDRHDPDGPVRRALAARPSPTWPEARGPRALPRLTIAVADAGRAAADVGCWPFSAVRSVCSNVGYWRISGRIMLKLSCSSVDLGCVKTHTLAKCGKYSSLP